MSKLPYVELTVVRFDEEDTRVLFYGVSAANDRVSFHLPKDENTDRMIADFKAGNIVKVELPMTTARVADA